MKVALFGGTGFVGSYLVDALVEVGLQPVVLVRPGSEDRVNHADRCTTVAGDIADPAAIESVLEGADAAIFNIGILREVPSRGVTFQALQEQAPKQAIDAASRLGVRRFILMSANGVEANSTDYQQTKLRAEQHLQESGLDWTIFRPSVVFGDPRGRMEFASQLKRDIIDAPLPAPLFFPGLNPAEAGRFELSPVHVRDVAAAFAAALLNSDTIGQIYRLGGPEPLSWRRILETIAAATGKQKTMLPVPAIGVSTAAALFGRWERFPITRDQITMLLQGNRCAPDDLVRLGIDPTPFNTESLRYLSNTTEEPASWHQNAA
ncbi:MAG: NAD(P)H-binding protein [Chromatiaceae bacterium]|jgi:NADH dehydrogenase